MKLGQDYIPRGLLANVAIQCVYPDSGGKIGSFLYLGEDRKKIENAVSPLFPDTYEMHKWCMVNGWRSIRERYIYEP